ncbi:MAG: molybdopterin molybdotransferase MoeA [Candidatus Omnitrophica bacterium]|nr:molybdopterin molybdotransferase MoeA [Candidatus Omnitrophota bacterium]
MITVAQAEKLVRTNVPAPRKGRIALAGALGCVLADDIASPVEFPLFDNSAMDGFALRSRDTRRASAGLPVRLALSGSLRAGETRACALNRGTACRIMTGAKIPRGADAVLAFEDAGEADGFLCLRAPVPWGNHVRRRGEEIRKGRVVLRRGAVINPGAVGLLASLGLTRVPVFLKPRVAILTTGDELAEPGTGLKPGRVYDSNGGMLAAALKDAGFPFRVLKRAADRPRSLERAVRAALKAGDILLLTGGVSAGDYDFAKSVLARSGVRTIFWKVNQKPGKPLYFGRAGRRLVFGLPGNPGAVFACFYEYALPALRKMAGRKDFALPSRTLAVRGGVRSAARFLFVRSRVTAKNGSAWAKPLSKQGSHMLSSLAGTQALIRVPPRANGRAGNFRVDLIPGLQGGRS